MGNEPIQYAQPSPAGEPVFIDEWYPEAQLNDLGDLLSRVLTEGVPGALVEIGCWEGRSTVRLAQVSAPSGRQLHAVDWWLGNVDEGEGHASVQALHERDVFRIFIANIAPFAHVVVHREEGGQFLTSHFGQVDQQQQDEAIAFVHLDAGHTYRATKNLIDLALPHLAPDGIICGDDYQNAHAGRTDLAGGVERAVVEAFHGEASTLGNLWFYRRSRVDPGW